MGKLATNENRELELKFTPSREVQARLRSQNDLSDVVSVLQAAFDLGDYTFVEEGTKRLVDDYYDTPDLALYRSHATFRVRHLGTKECEITLKTLLAQKPGVFDRKELNTPVTPQQLDDLKKEGFRSLLATQAPAYSEYCLQHVLSIVNDRRVFRLHRQDALLELCLDSFRCHKPTRPRSARRPSFEIEIEAKNMAALQRLLRIRNSIEAVLQSMVIEDKSKYEQSIELLGLNQGSIAQLARDLWNSPSFGNWFGAVLSGLGIIVALFLYWLQSRGR